MNDLKSESLYCLLLGVYCDQVSVVAALEDGGLDVLTRPGLQRLRRIRGTGQRITTMDMDTRLIVTGENIMMVPYIILHLSPFLTKS